MRATEFDENNGEEGEEKEEGEEGEEEDDEFDLDQMITADDIDE